VLLDYLLPTPCVLCLKTGSALCSSCESGFELSLHPFRLDQISGFSFTSYNDQSSKLVQNIKETSYTALVPFMAKFMLQNWPYQEAVTLVPIPSSPTNYRKRGFDHTLLLARALARGNQSIAVSQILKSSRDRKDQVLLGPKEREVNLNGAFKIRFSHRNQGPLVLLDDVLTTGATMRAAHQALTDIGLEAHGFCVFAHAGPRKPSK